MRRALLLAVVVLSACGRTGVLDDDAGVDGGVRDAGPREGPFFVAKGSGCPVLGVEADLKPASGERLALVRTKALEECSNAGGDALIGAEVATTRDLWVGEHTCFFLTPELRNDGEATYFGVARVQQTAGVRQTQQGWCLTRLDGGEPVSTDVTVQAWGLYRSEAAARAALTALGP